MRHYQFEVDIVSVHYYRWQKWVYCAILLSTMFHLEKDRLSVKYHFNKPLTAAHFTVRMCENPNLCGDRRQRLETVN